MNKQQQDILHSLKEKLQVMETKNIEDLNELLRNFSNFTFKSKIEVRKWAVETSLKFRVHQVYEDVDTLIELLGKDLYDKLPDISE